MSTAGSLACKCFRHHNRIETLLVERLDDLLGQVIVADGRVVVANGVETIDVEVIIDTVKLARELGFRLALRCRI